ncbi:hypothetical protein ACLJYM_06340 [Rhizobium giardinii]|uniref:hypothetical protein n=1 Tax=Rhizobium giardinii TaxID=56731 RepID=UPI0039E1FDF0
MTDPIDMLDWLDKRIASAELWIADHGRESKHPRPEHEIQIKETDIAMFTELRGAYAKAVERRKAAA